MLIACESLVILWTQAFCCSSLAFLTYFVPGARAKKAAREHPVILRVWIALLAWIWFFVMKWPWPPFAIFKPGRNIMAKKFTYSSMLCQSGHYCHCHCIRPDCKWSPQSTPKSEFHNFNRKKLSFRQGHGHCARWGALFHHVCQPVLCLYKPGLEFLETSHIASCVWIRA